MADDPEELGGIAIRGRLGQGGMGMVYFGVTADGEPVAVKTILAGKQNRPGALERFEREIRFLRMVQGPRVSALADAAKPDVIPQWLATEYIQGLTLAEYIRAEGPLDHPMVAILGILLAEALADIHRAGILHRDFKPGNIVLGADGPKVIDFGLAALADVDSDLTKTGDGIGTPHCMPPEQAKDPREVREPGDIYALGAVLLFAATRHYLYRRAPVIEFLRNIINPDVEPDLSGLPEPLVPPVRAMIAPDPADRPGLDEITAALTAVLAEAGLTVADAHRRLTELTYVERDTDPDLPRQPPPPPARARITDNPHVPGPLVVSIAEHLRRNYAREAVF